MSVTPCDPAEFTEPVYRGYLQAARAGWPIITFKQAATAERGCLWRHDVDLSVHRGLRLARIEADEGVTSTWFLTTRSPFYNLLEPEIIETVESILQMGHHLGLHVDVGAWGEHLDDAAELTGLIEQEKQLLEATFSRQVQAMSWHNPEGVPEAMVAADRVAGMVNAFSRSVRERFAYCSDSNGYWRYQRLGDLLGDHDQPRLQILTHPVWWVPEPMMPRQRISRAIDGRAAASHHHYDSILDFYGRENIRQ
jgi:hypothetical protein